MNVNVAKIVIFRLGEDLFAADIFSVERVLRLQATTTVPDLPPWIEGLIDYQRRVVPVINLRRRFELPEREARPETRLLILNAGDGWIGVVVDAVMEVASYAEGDLSPPPPLFRGLAGEYLKGILRRKDALVILLDVKRLLSSRERIVLEKATSSAGASVV